MNPFEHTAVIAFEVNNFCNLSWLHTQCPLHREMLSPFTAREPVTLPATLVHRCLEELGHCGWQGTVNFHQYNEPLLDPRLFEFIRRARATLPQATIELVTNGFGLNEQLIKELAEAGASSLHVSLYGSPADKAILTDRLVRGPYRLPIFLGRHELDDRAGIYDRAEVHSQRPCGAPLEFVTVTCRGEVGLCCFDWQRTATFGNLAEMSLGEALASEKAQETYRRLKAGDRFLDACKRCDRARGI